jgi:hypothetical protein
MRDIYTKEWIISNSVEIVDQYEKGILTLRALHYQLVGRGMINDIQHYKRVVSAMISARWDDKISFDTFSDLDRAMVGQTFYRETILEDEIKIGQRQIEAWMKNFHKNKWENQPYYPEIFIEKKALQGVFQDLCREWDVGLGACKGYPSLTFLNEAYLRFNEAEASGKKPIIIYFGDYDPSGEDIPRSIEENISRFGADVEVRRIALMEHQVIEWKLPPAPVKEHKKVLNEKTGKMQWTGDTRCVQWEGLGQVELDAVKPEKLMKLLGDAIEDIFDNHLYYELLEIEDEQRVVYQRELKQFVKKIK